jgi:hypothetical protein
MDYPERIPSANDYVQNSKTHTSSLLNRWYGAIDYKKKLPGKMTSIDEAFPGSFLWTKRRVSEHSVNIQ